MNDENNQNKTTTDNKPTLVRDSKIDFYNYNYLYTYARERIEEYISDPSNGIEDLKKEPQQVFNACIRYVGRNFIRPIIDANKIKDASHSIDPKLADLVLDVYIDITSLYNKELNAMGYSYFSGISITTIDDWYYYNGRGSTDAELTQARKNIVKKLTRLREDSLSNMLTSGKNPIGAMAILNHKYHWNSDDAIYTEKQRALTLNQLPALETLGKVADNSSN